MLTDIEKQKIIAFNQDEEMVEAVRKVLLATIYGNGVLKKGQDANPLKNGALALAARTVKGEVIMSNELLGEDLRGLAQGVYLLESGFVELAKVKQNEEEEEDEGVNEAR